MSGTQSKYNKTIVPLGGNKIFDGKWESVSAYTVANISVFTDMTSVLTVIGCMDESRQYQNEYPVTANQLLNIVVPLEWPNFKVTLRNSLSTPQTVLNLSTVYQVGMRYNELTGGAIDAGLDFSGSSVLVYDTNPNRFNQVLWATASTGAGGTSAVANLSGQNVKLVTLYGNSSLITTFTLQFSNDGTTFYNSGYTISAPAGDFGQSFAIGPKYLRVSSNTNVSTNLILNAC